MTDSTAPRWTTYVALGDSMSEGLWDVDPADPTRCRGWADLLAGALSQRRTAAGAPPLRYANLAVRGKLLGEILDEQLPLALEMAPDLVSLVGGGNDILRPGADVDALAARLEDGVARLRAAGADVLMATGVDTRDSPLIKATRGKVGIYNAHIWSIARRHGAHVLDTWGMASLRDWRLWADDRIHMSPEGHARTAQAALVALGLAPDDDRWDDPLAPLPPEAFAVRLRGNAQWVRQHAYPWVQRRLRRTSSGNGRTAKYPSYVEVDGTAQPA